jgi:Putative transmembrane protein (PGPGW)
VKAERRAERRRWLYRHPDAVIGWVVVALGVLLIPLPGPGWLVVAAGAVVLVAGALV